MTYSAENAVKKFRKYILDESTESKVSVEEATTTLKSYGMPAELLDAALAGIQADQSEHEHIGTVHDPATYTPWYIEPKPTGQWARYMASLKKNRAPGLDTLDSETTTITRLLANPAAPGSKRKGLVMGNVQSGKTRNFAGVIAKAADEGYKFVIVLSGINNNLREQTQVRLDTDLFGAPEWYPLTSDQQDFAGDVLKPETLFTGQELLCAVVKKNATRLQYLTQMLGSLSPEGLRRWPILIVDDEADQATPNSLAEKKRISTINHWVRKMWNLVQTGTYLAYTATPFANVLMDPDDDTELFPSDFITTIDAGAGYFGAERVFGISDTITDELEFDGLDMVRKIPPAEAAALRPPSNAEARELFDPDLPPSLREAFHWFVVATAIRRVRGQTDSHSSMLVHTTHYTAPHKAMKERITALREHLLQDDQGTTDSLLEAAWDKESTKVASEATLPLPSWEVVRAETHRVLAELTVIVDNGESEDRLNYDSDGPVKTVVAVGGGTLARGLTLEGLTVSYFTRTSNTYDTLLQMGRWFGYRPGYEDLPRVWVTDGLDREYAFLARVEKDLRDEIGSVQDSEYTPTQVGVKVRAHPGRLEITSRNKMFSSDIVQLGLSGTANQTFILDGCPSTIKHNFEVAGHLIEGLNFSPIRSGSARLIARGVSGERITKFIENFAAHEDQRWLSDPVRREAITNWISTWAGGRVWNIVLASSSRSTTHGETARIGNHEVVCLQRTPLEGSTVEQIDLKAIMSQQDRVADIDPATYDSALAKDEIGRRRVRRAHANGEGLILLYPLGSQAKVTAPLSKRIDMPTDRPLLGFGIVFPHIDDNSRDQGTFVSVRRNWDVPLTIEGDEDLQDEYGEQEEPADD